MLVRPKKTTYNKSQKKSHKYKVTKQSSSHNNFPVLGHYSLFASEAGVLQGKHLEIGRRIIRGSLQRKGLLWVMFFPHKPFTKKAQGMGMGKGKGAVSFFGVSIYPGQILYELSGVSSNNAIKAFKNLQSKLPIRTQVSIKNRIVLLQLIKI